MLRYKKPVAALDLDLSPHFYPWGGGNEKHCQQNNESLLSCCFNSMFHFG